MRYEGKIFRPGPTEYNSYLLQVTLGCSHNKCKFCNFYRDKPFRMRPYEELEEDIMMARKQYKHVPGVFLIDGNVTCLSMDRLRPILTKIREVFPESAHTNMFGTLRDINKKSVDELQEMKELGVKMIVAGLESGSDSVLSEMDKGYTADEAIAAGQKMNQAWVGLGTGIILGLGGVKHSEEHIKGSIRVLNEFSCTHVGITVYTPQTDSPLFADIQSGAFELPTYGQIFREEAEIVKGLNFQDPCIFSTGYYYPNNHIVAGQLPHEKDKVLREVESRASTYPQWLDKKIQIGGHM